jgi:Rhamnan synthesis protein F
MGAVSSMISVLRVLKNGLERRLFGLWLRDFDIWRQSRRLAGYTTGITRVMPCSPTDSASFAIFVYYEPGAGVSKSVQRAVQALRRLGVNTILVCNHALSEAQLAFFRDRCHTILLRDNQGFDFGAYKDAVAYLEDGDSELGRIMFLNDSVFYASKGLEAFLERLQGPEDLVGAFENWGEDHHLNSFAIGVSDHVFRSAPFRLFWRDYVPVSNRIHAIEKGEKRLTRAALAAARHSGVTYPVAALYAALLDADINSLDHPIRLPKPWRATFETIDRQTATHRHVANQVVDIINKTSPIHAGAYYFPKYLDCPIFKKDIVYRGRFQYWEVETWIHDVLPDDEAEEYLTTLRKRGDHSKLGFVDRKRFNVGVK